MSYSDPKPWHHVTVTSHWDPDEEMWDEPRIEFECAALYGDCHFYPACGCEWFEYNHFELNGPGHERVHHDRCWMQDWFEIPESLSYEGEDGDGGRDGGLSEGMNRSGRIRACCVLGEYVEWEFVGGAKS